MSDDDALLTTEGIEPGLERTPTVLVLDTSGSMSSAVADSDGDRRPRIEQLNDGLGLFKDEIGSMHDVKNEIDVGVITFGNGAEVVQDFTPVPSWEPAPLSAGGRTPMGDAILKAADMIDNRKEKYKNEGIPYNQPFVWVLTDGKPTDMKPGDEKWQEVKDTIHSAEAESHFVTFLMTIGNEAETEIVSQLHEDRTIPLKDGTFEEYFEFLSNSMREHSNTEEDETTNIGETAQDYDDIFEI